MRGSCPRLGRIQSIHIRRRATAATTEKIIEASRLGRVRARPPC
jgi:hypothetical protein